GLERQVAELVPLAVDPIARLAGVRATGHDLLLDRDTDLAQRRLVALERRPPCVLARGVLVGELGGDLDEAQRLARLEQQCQQVGEAFDAVGHTYTMSCPAPARRDAQCAAG